MLRFIFSNVFLAHAKFMRYITGDKFILNSCICKKILMGILYVVWCVLAFVLLISTGVMMVLLSHIAGLSYDLDDDYKYNEALDIMKNIFTNLRD